MRFGLKLGAQYKLNDPWTLGASYTENWTAFNRWYREIQISGVGLRIVKYNNLSIKGFALPREFAIGTKFKPNIDWLLSEKVNWLNWADSINDITNANDTNNVLDPQTTVVVSPQNWQNQVVYAFCLAYSSDNLTTLYAVITMARTNA